MEWRGLKLVAIIMVIGLAVSVAWAGQPAMKRVAAPPADVQAGLFRLPQPEEAGIRSHSAMVPVTLTPGNDGSWSWEGDLPVDSAEGVSLMLLAPDADRWEATIAEPGEAPVRLEDFSWRGNVRREEAWLGTQESAVPGELWRIEHPAVGDWHLKVRSQAPPASGKPVDGYVLVGSKSPFRLFSNLATYHLVPGEAVGLVARVYDAREQQPEGGAPRALRGLVRSAVVTIGLPDGSTLTLPMADDGRNADGAAGDGVFGALFTAEEAGDYTAQVRVAGRTPDGAPFLRTTEHVFPVVPVAARLTGEASLEQVEDGVALRLGAAEPSGSARVLVSAELWGTSAGGDMVPVVWTSGIVESDGDLVLKFDPRWLSLAQASAPFELRNVSVRDVDTFVPVSTAETLEARVVGELVPPKAVTGITDEMLMGPRPQHAPVSATKSSGGKLLLVHGYCSGGVWPTSHFSNYAVFQDYHQNRTHDQFAQLIRNFGAQFPSFGIVAHSQGGCAALHLYTYYWSGLDYSSGSRLIQSVGTPYQGTSLAGNLALLGQIFGVGCGSNWDLTYDGARLWLSGIPWWARNRVYYATTSFEDKWWRYDYCNMASDVVLDDPDDGTTERWAGQLSGGHNMGHKEGWCHTSGMRDPAQTTDYSRNYWMNIYANR